MSIILERTGPTKEMDEPDRNVFEEERPDFVKSSTTSSENPRTSHKILPAVRHTHTDRNSRADKSRVVRRLSIDPGPCKATDKRRGNQYPVYQTDKGRAGTMGDGN